MENLEKPAEAFRQAHGNSQETLGNNEESLSYYSMGNSINVSLHKIMGAKVSEAQEEEPESSATHMT